MVDEHKGRIRKVISNHVSLYNNLLFFNCVYIDQNLKNNFLFLLFADGKIDNLEH